MSPLYYIVLFFLLLPVSALLAWCYFGFIAPTVRRWRTRNRYRATRYRLLCD